MPRGRKGRTYEQIVEALKESERTDVVVLDKKRISCSGYQWLWKCTNSKCSHEWYAEYSQVLGSRGYGCDKCARVQYGRETRLTEDEVRARVRESRDDVELVNYAGRTKDKSTWKCKKCGHIWFDTFWHIVGDRKGVKAFCPNCHNIFKHSYNIDGIAFDSSWEAIFYLHHKTAGHRVYRLHREIGFPYKFEGRTATWYPDFFLYPHYDLVIEYPNIFQEGGIIVEVKPDNGGQDPFKTLAKKVSGWDVEWVGSSEIKYMENRLVDLGVDVNQYRVA